MTTVYYAMPYKAYKLHTHRFYGHEIVGHSVDNPMTEDSVVVLKVSAPDHIHHYLETNKIRLADERQITGLQALHPVMRRR